jgi:tRNA 2-thiocytidine biosynthesis protein TtcA
MDLQSRIFHADCAMTPVKSKIFYKIKRQIGKAIGDFDLINDGDHIAVAVSGGKDSYTMLHVLETLRRRAPVTFRLTAINVDLGYPGYRKDILEEHLKQHGFAYRMVATECYRIVEEKRDPGSSYCSFCARLRRGVLYTEAEKAGCNKIALAHHLDDFIETLLLNQFYVGRLAAMSPKMLADNKKHTVIRPLVYVEERDIIRFATESNFPIICCACPVCGSADQKRKQMKNLLKELAKDNPRIKNSMIRALSNVQPRYLMDKRLKPFT